MLRLCLFFACLSLMASSCHTAKKTSMQKEKREYIFPLDWIGEYTGELHIFSATQDTNTIDMTLTIGNPNAEGYYPWVIKYGEDDIRSYGLEAINAVTGHYIVDEFNSIRLDGFLRDNHFISHFEVLNSTLLVDYERVPEGILVNLYVSNSDPMNTTGGEIFAKDTVPTVKSFAVPVFQSALLKKSHK